MLPRPLKVKPNTGAQLGGKLWTSNSPAAAIGAGEDALHPGHGQLIFVLVNVSEKKFWLSKQHRVSNLYQIFVSGIPAAKTMLISHACWACRIGECDGANWSQLGVTNVAEITRRSLSIIDFSRARSPSWLQSQTQELEEFFFLTTWGVRWPRYLSSGVNKSLLNANRNSDLQLP